MGRRGLILGAAALATVVASGAIIAGSRAGVLPTLPGWAPMLDLPTGYDPYAEYPDDFVLPMGPDDLFEAFGRDRGDAYSYGEPVTVETRDAGLLTLPSGRIVATDALELGGVPFSVEAPPGTHPVTVLTVTDPFGPGRVTAAAMVRVGRGDPVRWDSEPFDPSLLDDVDPFMVTGGSAALLSPEAMAALGDDADFDAYRSTVEAQLSEDVAVEIGLDAAAGANAVAFDVGDSAGWLGMHVGLDADGQPVAYLIDFALLDAP